MTRDPAVVALLSPLEATFRRMSSHERRALFLSRELRLRARHTPPASACAAPQLEPAAGDGLLRCVQSPLELP